MVLRFHLHHYHFISKILTLSLLSIACGVGLVFPSSTVSDRDSYNTMCVALKLKVDKAEPVSINFGQDDLPKLDDLPDDVLKLVLSLVDQVPLDKTEKSQKCLDFERLGRLGRTANIFDILCHDELEVRIQEEVERLGDSKYKPLKRGAAIEVLSKLPVEKWTRNARVDTLVGWLKHEDQGVRIAAIEIIGNLPPGALTHAHVNTIAGALTYDFNSTRTTWQLKLNHVTNILPHTAIKVLGKLPYKVLTADHVKALARLMKDKHEDEDMREAAKGILIKSGSWRTRLHCKMTHTKMQLSNSLSSIVL